MVGGFGHRTELELESLADWLISNPNLRAEVASRVGIRSIGEPSSQYKAWKHRANRLADALGNPQRRQVELIIEHAITLTNRKAS